MKNKPNPSSIFERMSSVVTKASGSTPAFILALCTIIVWLVTGPLFHFSDTWQLVINTGTTIITFLMVFLIQRSQNKDSIALHLKLNELIVANESASNRLVAIEDISEAELKVLQKFYRELAILSLNELPVTESHSIHQAQEHHEMKKTARKHRKK